MYTHKTIYTYGERLHEHIGFDGRRFFCPQKHGKNALKQDLMWLTVLVALAIATLGFVLVNKNW